MWSVPVNRFSGTMRINLRQYQRDGIDGLRAAFACGHRSILYVLPTGGGKTVVFCAIAELAAAKGNRVAILVHRQELVDQTSRSLRDIGVEHGTVVAGQRNLSLEEPLQICSVQTLVRRLDKIDPSHFDLVVVDEAHHAVAGSWRKILDHFSEAKVLGVTATPERLDGKGLKDVFTHMVLGPDAQTLTNLGYLCPARAFVPPQEIDTSLLRVRAGEYRLDEAELKMSDRVLVGDAVAHYKSHLYPRTAIAFCCTIRHAKIVCAAFVEAGIAAEVLDGKTAKDVRLGMIQKLGRGEIQVLCTCMVVSEGTDVPSVGGCLLMRPTKSLSLYLQQVGRCLRPSPGKERAVILDHAGNIKEHGLPTAARAWSLEGREVRERAEAKESLSVKVCPKCFATVESNYSECPECGHEFESQNKLVEVEGELEELLSFQVGDLVRLADSFRLTLRTSMGDLPPNGWKVEKIIPDHSMALIRQLRSNLEEKKRTFLVSFSSIEHIRTCADEQDDKRLSTWQERGESKRKRTEVARARTLPELQELAAERGYAPGWAFHIYRSRQVRRYGAQQ